MTRHLLLSWNRLSRRWFRVRNSKQPCIKIQHPELPPPTSAFPKNSIADVFIRKEFDRLKKINELYRYQTAEFLIKNNFHKHLLQHKNLSLAVVRIYFSGIWEWHIREEIVQIINDIEKEYFGTRKPDCMWMLKSKESASTPVYYCDAAFLSFKFFQHSEYHTLGGGYSCVKGICELPLGEIMLQHPFPRACLLEGCNAEYQTALHRWSVQKALPEVQTCELP